MVHAAAEEKDIFASPWGKVHVEEVGQTCSREHLLCLCHHEKLQVKFRGKVLTSFGEATRNLDDLKATFVQLSGLPWDMLQADPETFRMNPGDAQILLF
ncbi:hemoglobin subunit epsilon-like [Ailuropoda melanoleuca]|uniref:hemoglobin subunit epsilon-like n=1 Tax=Ailuropoda melanoleuca TaxID=9646 RepID=UPI000947A8E3|nr:hemoglobin subunit epsilon-like [Ailuropoda melanoleuca]